VFVSASGQLLSFACPALFPPQEAADAIHGIHGLPAVQRHKELEEPLRHAEEWARREYLKVRERNGDRDAVTRATWEMTPPLKHPHLKPDWVTGERR
jgi:hypothetical protein